MLSWPHAGAPHNMDEGWTIFAGGHPQQCDTPLQQADRLAADLGLSYFGKSPVRNAFTVEFNNAYASSLQGNSSESIARHTVANAVQLTQMTVMHVQVGLVVAAAGCIAMLLSAHVATACL